MSIITISSENEENINLTQLSGENGNDQHNSQINANVIDNIVEQLHIIDSQVTNMNDSSNQTNWFIDKWMNEASTTPHMLNDQCEITKPELWKNETFETFSSRISAIIAERKCAIKKLQEMKKVAINNEIEMITKCLYEYNKKRDVLDPLVHNLQNEIQFIRKQLHEVQHKENSG